MDTTITQIDTIAAPLEVPVSSIKTQTRPKGSSSDICIDTSITMADVYENKWNADEHLAQGMGSRLILRSSNPLIYYPHVLVESNLSLSILPAFTLVGIVAGAVSGAYLGDYLNHHISCLNHASNAMHFMIKSAGIASQAFSFGAITMGIGTMRETYKALDLADRLKNRLIEYINPLPNIINLLNTAF